MFFQPPDDKQTNLQTKSRNRSQRKGKRKVSLNNFKNFKKKIGFVDTMSAWAESFTVAATWQLKHQLAYWKARAKSLEYENNILHDVIRKNCLKSSPVTYENQSEGTDTSYHGLPYPSAQPNHVPRAPDSDDLDSNDEMSHEENSEDEELEVSEEFIEFLKQNAKYKEDARLERERLKAKMAEISVTDQLEAGPSGSPVNKTEELQELYGANWKRIAATEMSVQSNFISNIDRSKPMYWPNIPFNFS